MVSGTMFPKAVSVETDKWLKGTRLDSCKKNNSPSYTRSCLVFHPLCERKILTSVFILILKTHEMFSAKNLKTHLSLVILDLSFRNIRAKKSHDYRNIIAFTSFRFPNVFRSY